MNKALFKKISPRCFSLPVFLFSFHAYGSTLLDCELTGGYPGNQIYINEKEGYVLYNAQYRATDDYSRARVYQSDSGPIEIDEGLDIITNNNYYIAAQGNLSSLVFVKKNATFAYAWTVPYPHSDGSSYIPFGNNTAGKCSANPFSQP